MPKQKKKKSTTNTTNQHNNPTEDRFAAAETRPQFRASSQHSNNKNNQQKVVLDERFSSILTDPRFQSLEAGADKYGRSKTNKKKKAAVVQEELSAFYTIQKEKEGEDTTRNKDKERKEPHSDKDDESSTSSSSSSSNKEQEHEDPASRIAYLTKLSRGELEMSDTSSSDDDDEDASHSSNENQDSNDDEGDEEDKVYGSAGILDPSSKAQEEEEIDISYEDSPYLVATNLDWENLRAVDIFSILSSFAPPGGVKRVQVYQSDFGKERMEKDALNGPSNIWKKQKAKASKEEDEDSEEEVGDDDDSNDKEGESDNEKEQDEDESSVDDDDDDDDLLDEQEKVYDESDFDPEKLRAYEASKLKYYFAIVEFTKPEHADIAYREVDGMEFEHSSSAIDLRTLPPEALEDVVKDRSMRDQATSIPSNYEPPDFVVSALQQTNVQCTWDQGDAERERKLTRYTNGAWQDMAEADDLKAYLASDASSDEESGDDGKATKGSNMRKLLGLDSDNDDKEDSDSSQASSEQEGDEESENEGGMTMKFVPGAKNLEEKIRSKLESKNAGQEEEKLTPFQKYQEKRKQRRRERKQAKKNGNKEEEAHRKPVLDDDSDKEDDFFLDDKETSRPKKDKNRSKDSEKLPSSSKSSKQELELLLAGENDVEEARDYDIRGIQRMEKIKGKKFRGSRKRKEEKLSADVSGKDFQVDVQDSRFAAVLEGSDDRFGIDKTDPHFKDTPAMQKILSEQRERRNKKRKKTSSNASKHVVPDVDADKSAKSSGASALSALVKKLKTQVS